MAANVGYVDLHEGAGSFPTWTLYVSAMNILEQLERDEGKRYDLYDDATSVSIKAGSVVKGNPTIGVGRDLAANPLSEGAVQYLLQEDVHIIQEALSQFAWFTALDMIRQGAVINVAFNDGIHGLLHYPHMIAALARSDWPIAAQECTSSDPRLTARYARLAQQILTGEWR
jgi:lysozyme